MPKPPQSTPHSDIDGVRRDEKQNAQKAREAGQDAGDLKRAQLNTPARPDYSDDRDDEPSGNKDDRSV